MDWLMPARAEVAGGLHVDATLESFQEAPEVGGR